MLQSLALVLMLTTVTSHSARILGIIPSPSISHQLPFRPIMLELARRGHQVTYITTDPVRKNITNYTEIDVSETYEYVRGSFDFSAASETSPIQLLYNVALMGKTLCELQLGSPQLQDFIKSQQTFDVIILERFFYQCYYGIVHKLGSPPLIGFTSTGASFEVYESYGNPSNPAYFPEFALPYTDHMSFWQRLHNLFVTQVMKYSWHYVINPMQEEVLKKYFGPGLPSVYETERNFSILLANNHFSMNYPRPILPTIIELTGLNLEKQRQPLPKNIKSFLDGAKNGVIYFSMGSNVRSSALPEEKRRAFLEAFAQLPQRVLWKWETDSLPGQPQNVMIAKWLPQQDVLAHPNIRLFITQGGLQSMNEAAYFAVPLIGIPIMGDQPHNVAKMEEAGIGYHLDFKKVTRESFVNAINTVLTEKSYVENMKRFSAVFREHQETSLERAVWWIEYVIRHKGAPHLRSAALDLHWWQLLLLDVIAFVIVLAAITFYVIYRVAKCIMRSLHRVSKQKSE